jgi:hypothetical protein
MTHLLKREAILLTALLAFGLLVLPFVIYLIGAQLFGEYEPGANAFSFLVDLWLELYRGHRAAWLLVGSPYLVIQGVRLAGVFWRSRKSVTHVTESAPGTRNWRL